MASYTDVSHTDVSHTDVSHTKTSQSVKYSVISIYTLEYKQSEPIHVFSRVSSKDQLVSAQEEIVKKYTTKDETPSITLRFSAYDREDFWANIRRHYADYFSLTDKVFVFDTNVFLIDDLIRTLIIASREKQFRRKNVENYVDDVFL